MLNYNYDFFHSLTYFLINRDKKIKIDFTSLLLICQEKAFINYIFIIICLHITVKNEISIL